MAVEMAVAAAMVERKGAVERSHLEAQGAEEAAAETVAAAESGVGLEAVGLAAVGLAVETAVGVAASRNATTQCLACAVMLGLLRRLHLPQQFCSALTAAAVPESCQDSQPRRSSEQGSPAAKEKHSDSIGQ